MSRPFLRRCLTAAASTTSLQRLLPSRPFSAYALFSSTSPCSLTVTASTAAHANTAAPFAARSSLPSAAATLSASAAAGHSRRAFSSTASSSASSLSDSDSAGSGGQVGDWVPSNAGNLPGMEAEQQIAALQSQVRLHLSHGRTAQALEAAEECLAVTNTVFGKNHPVYASALNNLGMACKENGHYEDAVEHFGEAVRVYRAVLGDDHPSTATGMHNCAALYKNVALTKKGFERQELLVAAKEMYSDALEVRKKVLESPHHDIVATMQQLGGTMRMLKEADEAEVLLVGGADMAAVLCAGKDDSLQLATALNNLAFFYKSEGSFEQARPLYERAVVIREAKRGPRHQDTIVSKNNLAELHLAMGDEEAAKAIQLEIITAVSNE